MSESIRLEDVLNLVAEALRRDHPEQALPLLGNLLRSGINQRLPLMVQRFLAELSMECAELAGEHEQVLAYLDEGLARYTDHPPQSPEARKDRLILMLRKGFLLVKLERREDLLQHLQLLKSQLSPGQRVKLRRTLDAFPRYASSASNRLLAEQRELGLFGLSEQVRQRGGMALQLEQSA